MSKGVRGHDLTRRDFCAGMVQCPGDFCLSACVGRRSFGCRVSRYGGGRTADMYPFKLGGVWVVVDQGR